MGTRGSPGQSTTCPKIFAAMRRYAAAWFSTRTCMTPKLCGMYLSRRACRRNAMPSQSFPPCFMSDIWHNRRRAFLFFKPHKVCRAKGVDQEPRTRSMDDFEQMRDHGRFVCQVPCKRPRASRSSSHAKPKPRSAKSSPLSRWPRQRAAAHTRGRSAPAPRAASARRPARTVSSSSSQRRCQCPGIADERPA